MGLQRRLSIPISELSEKLLSELLEDMRTRWPSASAAGVAGLALHRGLVEMRASMSVASGAPPVEWRRTG